MKTYIINILFWLALWQGAALLADSPLLLPGPIGTATALMTLMAEGGFYLNIAYTFGRCAVAMLISLAAGTTVAWGAYNCKNFRSLMIIPTGFFKAVPVMAVIIYAILFIPAGWVAVAVCFLMCFPIVYTNILAGLDAMPREFIELARVYELTKSQTIRYVYAPGISAQIKSAVRLIAGLSWKAVVAAEVLSIPRYSLGYEMMNAKYYLDTENLFAYIAVIVGLSLAIEKLIDKWILKGATSAYEGSKLFAGSGEKVAETKFSEAPTIVVQDLSKTYGDNQVLVSLNMEFEGGRGTAVTAPSGRGKTTLARIIAGLEKADSGSVEASGPVKLSYLFQEDRLFPWLNIYDNMAIGLLREGQCDEKRIEKMAKALEIEDALWKLPEELSGGMKHRAAMGRTFLAESNVMILDEPFRGLNGELKEDIISRLWASQTGGKTVIVITHDEELLQKVDLCRIKI